MLPCNHFGKGNALLAKPTGSFVKAKFSTASTVPKSKDVPKLLPLSISSVTRLAPCMALNKPGLPPVKAKSDAIPAN